MKPAHLTLVDADRYSALVSRCTQLRERAEMLEKVIRAFFEDYDADDAESANHIILPIEAMRAAIKNAPGG